uniref:Uracil phosphoribosyltransferase homolog n=1 Tax=Cacopsylla melanoneura TaxID=428564 RepID=A0A8D8LV73_9HEMI
MEQGLRDCCRSIRIGKILIESDAETHEARIVYARFPEDIAQRYRQHHYQSSQCVERTPRVRRKHHPLQSVLHTHGHQMCTDHIPSAQNADLRNSPDRSESFWSEIFWHGLGRNFCPLRECK